MMTAENVSLLALQPEFLRSDPVTRAICGAFDPLFRQLSEQMRGLLIYTNLEHLGGELLNEIAWGLDIGWYDSSASLAERRRVVRGALSIFHRIGTPSAVRDAVSAGFGDARVEEWFEYGGKPGSFKIIVENPSATSARAVAFLEMVRQVKNVRSHLESITIMKASSAALGIGAASMTVKSVRSETIG